MVHPGHLPVWLGRRLARDAAPRPRVPGQGGPVDDRPVASPVAPVPVQQRGGPDLTDDELVVLDLLTARRRRAMAVADLRREAEVPEVALGRAVLSLVERGVVDVAGAAGRERIALRHR